MKFLLRVMLAFGCWLVMVAHAEAAPVRCSYGYQDSTCTTPIRNGPIPQPQCSTGAGWTTTAAAVWQGSRWSAPQCNYQAPSTCPVGQVMTSPPVWNGSSWSQPACQLPAPQLPAQKNWAQICNAAVAAAQKFYVTFLNSDFAPYQFGTGVSTMVGGRWGTGPSYVDGDYSGNDYEVKCAVRIDNGTIYQLQFWPVSGYQGG